MFIVEDDIVLLEELSVCECKAWEMVAVVLQMDSRISDSLIFLIWNEMVLEHNLGSNKKSNLDTEPTFQ